MAEKTMQSVSANVKITPRKMQVPKDLKARIYMTCGTGTPDYDTAIEIVKDGYSSLPSERREPVKSAILNQVDARVQYCKGDFDIYMSKNRENIFKYKGMDISQLNEKELLEVGALGLPLSDKEHALFMAKLDQMSAHKMLSTEDAEISYNESCDKIRKMLNM